MWDYLEADLDLLPDMLTSSQVAKLLNMGTMTVNRRIRDGLIPAIDISGPGASKPAYRIPKQGLIDWVESSKVIKRPQTAG